MLPAIDTRWCNVNSERPPISGLIIAYNEADRIGECLKSMQTVCRELIVLDAHSTDGTAEVARRAGARVVTCDWPGFTQQRNRALEMASCPWALFLDADERLSADLARQIHMILDAGADDHPVLADIDGFDLPFRTHFLGKNLRFGASASEHHVRLFRTKIRYRPCRVHEVLRFDPDGHLKVLHLRPVKMLHYF